MENTDLTNPHFWQLPSTDANVDRLRSESPIVKSYSASEGEFWSVLSYEHADLVLRDTSRFSSRNGSLLGSVPGTVHSGTDKMMALTDPPGHRRMRHPVNEIFSRKGIEAYRPAINKFAVQALSCVREGMLVDLVDVLARPPLQAMCDLFGVPNEDQSLVSALSSEAFEGGTPEVRGNAHHRLLAMFLDLALERRKRPKDDLISAFANTVVGDAALSIEEVVLNIDNVFVGGVQTVRHTAVMSAWAILKRPDLWTALKGNPSLVPAAVEELLRYTSVALHVLRTATEDVQLAGVNIKAGDRIVIWTKAANHDPAVFDNPHEIDFFRVQKRNLAFGIGPHYCLGVWLARAELTELLNVALLNIEACTLIDDPAFNNSLINQGLRQLLVVPR
jgi:cytochrome P450